jgi:ABC-type phosphate transport system ATPase subunit
LKQPTSKLKQTEVQMTPSVDPWGYATIGWVKNRMTEKYQAMRANGKMIATDDKIKSRAIRTVRLI